MGIGTPAPAAQLDISSAGGNSFPQLQVNQSNLADFSRVRFEVGGNYNQRWDLGAVSNVFIIYSGFFNSEMLRLDSAGLTVRGAFVSSSDRNLKENFRTISPRQLLAKVASLPLSEWNYKQDPGTRHLGPMAQDFQAAFGLGTDDKHIATVDADGVAIGAIQGLNQKLDDIARKKDEEISSLKRQNAALAERLAALERLVSEQLQGSSTR